MTDEFSDDGSERLQPLIQAGRGELPSSAQLNSLSRRLGPILGAGLAAGAAATLGAKAAAAGQATTAGAGAAGAGAAGAGAAGAGAAGAGAAGAGAAGAGAAGAGAGAAATTAIGAGAAGVIKASGIAVVTAAMIGGASWFAMQPSSPSLPEQQHSRPPSAASGGPVRANDTARQQTDAPSAEEPTELPVLPEVDAPTADPEPAPSAGERAPAPGDGRVPSGAKSHEETALLRRAQALVKTDPRHALALTEQHRRLFPKGTLAQEREVIAIEALARLGRSEEASKRAGSFAGRYPGSAHMKKVQAVEAAAKAAPDAGRADR